MTNHDAAVLGIRFAALYAAYKALDFIAGIGMAISDPSPQSRWPLLLTYLLLLLIFAIGAVLLFKKAPALAGYFLESKEESRESNPSPHSPSAAAVGFAIVGLAGLVLSTPRLTMTLIELLRINPLDFSQENRVFLSTLPWMMGVFAQAILSFFMLLKSRALAEWWQRKQAGTAE